METQNIESQEAPPLTFNHYVPVRNVAERWSVSPNTVYKMLDEKELKGIQIRSERRILWEDVMRYEEENPACRQSEETSPDSTLEEKKANLIGISGGMKDSPQKRLLRERRTKAKLTGN